ncbi:HK97 family phage prohead protease [Paludisphaera borealis]|uniref:Prohead serine protease domain-containing protein n=1 Tax=Paludisphaera borealis TaxID=1387353 RepID=A0A1U7CNG0_9BACT|nr:HK97 family phage prohead protease [Paludisphaera borealis]APW60475.1 hypothetical protein BSF38_01945 [Paludisphaera borealis]
MSFKYRRRVAESPGLQTRAEGDSQPRKLTGHAAVFGEWYVICESPTMVIREVIRPGAFSNAINEKQDVRCLVDHCPSQILGRTRAGTLTLSEDAQGLFFECTPPDTQVARDVTTNIDAGNVSQCSFAFVPRDGGETVTQRTENGVTTVEYEVTDVDLYDVSVVTYPAYESTDVEVRSKELAKYVKDEWLKQRRNELDRLAAVAAK